MRTVENPMERPFPTMTGMVLHELEKCLGKYINETSETHDDIAQSGAYKKIYERLSESLPKELITIKNIIESSYLEEIFSMAIASAKGTHNELALNYLKQLFIAMDVYQIRNYFSHPNRPFLPCYFYRIAAIASDPVISQLGFDSVIDKLYASEAGIISEPPEEWMNCRKWSIDNNLPDYTDHNTTGLIGRSKEIVKLKTLLEKGRFPLISIQGYGGSGKTALLLQLLNDIIDEASFSLLFDHILYYSAKSTKLTLDGAVQITPDITKIEDITYGIFEHFDLSADNCTISNIPKHITDSKVLLCIDNLEDVLIANQTEFDQFYQELPRTWQVIVTSRISVNSGYAFPLEPMSAEGAGQLAREYYLRRTGKKLENAIISEAVSLCDGNPLAIRLVVDAMIAGCSLTEAAKVSRDNILSFSYSNLITSLTEYAAKIMECMFVLSRPVSRAEICSILSFDIELVAQAFSDLSNTALIGFSRDSNGELFELNSSVRDLMLINPVDLISRKEIENIIRESRKQSQSMHKTQFHKAHIRYTQDDCDEMLTSILAQCIKLLTGRGDKRNPNHAKNLMDRLRQRLTINPDDKYCTRAISCLLIHLNDLAGAKSNLEKIATPGSNLFDLPGALLLAKLYLQDQELNKAEILLDLLANAGYLSEEHADPLACRELQRIRLKTWLFLKKYSNVFDFTYDWDSKHSVLRSTNGILRAECYRRSIENEYWKMSSHGTTHPVEDGLTLAGNIIDKLVESEGNEHSICIEGLKLIEQMAYAFEHLQLTTTTIDYFAQFVMRHYLAFSIVDYRHEHMSLDKKHSIIATIAGSNMTKEVKETYFVYFAEELKRFDMTCESISKQIITSVYHIPNRIPVNCVFSNDFSGKQYYVGKANIIGGLDVLQSLHIGDRLLLEPDHENTAPGKAISCKWAKAYRPEDLCQQTNQQNQTSQT